jgi:hypothetical protein
MISEKLDTTFNPPSKVLLPSDAKKVRSNVKHFGKNRMVTDSLILLEFFRVHNVLILNRM